MTQANGNGNAVRNGQGKFLPGHRGMGGRPVGARNRLAEQFLADLQKQWKRSGKAALERTAEADPVAFCKIVASLMPKEIDSTLNVNVDLFAKARTRLEAYRMARDYIGSEDDEPLMIEAKPIEVEDEQSANESEFPELEPGEPQLERFDEIFFDVFAEGGEAALRQLLDLFPDLPCETLEDAALALKKAGKLSIAAIVLEIASERPSELDAILARYPEGHVYPLCKANIWFKRRARLTGEPEAELRARYTENQQ